MEREEVSNILTEVLSLQHQVVIFNVFFKHQTIGEDAKRGISKVALRMGIETIVARPPWMSEGVGRRLMAGTRSSTAYLIWAVHTSPTQNAIKIPGQEERGRVIVRDEVSDNQRMEIHNRNYIKFQKNKKAVFLIPWVYRSGFYLCKVLSPLVCVECSMHVDSFLFSYLLDGRDQNIKSTLSIFYWT